MQNLAQPMAVCNKYERRPSKQALIRKICGGDPMVAEAARLYASRWRYRDAVLEKQDGVWVAQPMRCFADELDLSLAQTKKVLAKLQASDLFEIESRKVWPTSQRLTTHLRPTGLFRLFLHRIGWWTQEEAAELETKHGVWLNAHMARLGARYMALGGAPNEEILEGGGDIAFGEAPLPPANLTTTITPQKKTTSPPDPPAEPTMAFAPRPPKTPAPVKPKYGSMAEAASAVLAKPKKQPKGEKALLWKDVAGVIQGCGISWPVSAPPALLARLWQLQKDLIKEYPEQDGSSLLLKMVGAAAKDWDAFAEWMLANSSQAKSIPSSFDLLWLQFHRQKAVEYAMLDPVQTSAPKVDGTKAALPGWTVV